jgi:DNA-binding MarR family transcriptional regulator
MVVTTGRRTTTDAGAPQDPAGRSLPASVVDAASSARPVGTAGGPRPTPEEAARAVARLFPEVYRRYHYARRPAGYAQLPVTRRGMEVLIHLAAGGPVTIGEQADHLGLRRNTTSELVARLEAKGLVARIRDERDERCVLVWLTDAGRDVVGRVGQVLAPDLLTLVMTSLAPADRETVVRGFELLARAEDPGTVPAPSTGAPVASSPGSPARTPDPSTSDPAASARSRRPGRAKGAPG